MKNKIFKNLDEQLEILKSKGLIIKDEQAAKEILFRENYFFINGYRHLFMESMKANNFLAGTTFEELYAAFVFDRRVRNIFFKYILVIENNVKSIISYTLSKKYGFKEKDYLNPKNYTQDQMKTRQVKDVLKKMKRQVRINGGKHSATMHYLSNYGYIPMWVLVKVLSFGIVSELFNILRPEEKTHISEHYDITDEMLSTFLALLSNSRNLCAHEDILYDHKMQREIPDNKFHYLLKLDMTDEHYNYGKNDLFALVIILKHMLSKEDFKGFIYEIGYEIDFLDGKVDVVPLTSILSKMGLPENWRDILNVD